MFCKRDGSFLVKYKFASCKFKKDIIFPSGIISNLLKLGSVWLLYQAFSKSLTADFCKIVTLFRLLIEVQLQIERQYTKWLWKREL